MTVPPDIDDKELLLKMRDGDQSAFNAIYHRYKTKIAIKLFAVLKVDAIVEDTLQELFFRIWDKRASIDPDQNIAGYLYRIATNLALDHFRQLAREQRLIVPKELPQPSDDLHTYQAKLDEELFKLIDQLPDQRKRVFILCKFENKSYAEVGDMLHISTHAVKDHVVKANKFLKNNYQKLAPWLVSYVATCALTDFL